MRKIVLRKFLSLYSDQQCGACDWFENDDHGKEWSSDRTGNLTIFEIKNGGMISRCGYIKEGVLGSGLNGITIASILK